MIPRRFTLSREPDVDFDFQREEEVDRLGDALAWLKAVEDALPKKGESVCSK